MFKKACPPVIPLPLDTYVLDLQFGDVNGDRIRDNIFLVGKKPFGDESPFRDQIRIIIQDCRSNELTQITPQFNAGYNPQLLLGDFNGDRIADIFVNIDSGGSGGFVFSYIYSFAHNIVNELFNFQDFNSQVNYRVHYLDFYRVDVANLTRNKLYRIDLSARDSNYLSFIYDEDGKLKAPITGSVSGLVALYPIDSNLDGVWDLEAVQRIVGIANADTLGYVRTYLRWQGLAFTEYDQYVSILSVPLISPQR